MHPLIHSPPPPHSSFNYLTFMIEGIFFQYSVQKDLRTTYGITISEFATVPWLRKHMIVI